MKKLKNIKGESYEKEIIGFNSRCFGNDDVAGCMW